MSNQRQTESRSEEYITIIAATIGEAMQRFHDSGLAAQGYSIAGPVGRHQFAYVGSDDSTELFDGTPMIAATFFRTAAA